MGKKEQTIEQELKDYLDKTYEKAVPAQVREYLESRSEQDSEELTNEQEQNPVPRERSTRQTRRQREQAESSGTSNLETQTGVEGQNEEETQGMKMNM